MNRTIHYQINNFDADLTVGSFLRMKGFSRHILSHLKQTDHGICLNGVPVFTSCLLKPGDQLTIRIIEAASSERIEPVCLPLSIVYEDEDILAVNKPAGMPVHPSYGNYNNTLANSVAYYYQQQKIPYVFRCINRIDRDTSGLLLLAKHMLSGALLSKAMKEHRIHRTYLALVWGHPSHSSGTITVPIARSPHSILERQADPSGEPAVTHYEVLCSFEQASLVKFHLETGRTHQIRVHMKYLGHPLLGDFLYNPGNHDCPRQALHSWSLAFSHPLSEKPMSFKCPLPEDMKSFLLSHSLIKGDFSLIRQL
ncbi:MAG: RluA family pseudouridine synthase [Ruminococcus sp.]|jgi:23S rRNA pseudouridine1911/1915/1917 synthase